MSLLKPKRKFNTWVQNRRLRYYNNIGMPGQPILGVKTAAQLARKLRSKHNRAQRKHTEELRRQELEALRARTRVTK